MNEGYGGPYGISPPSPKPPPQVIQPVTAPGFTPPPRPALQHHLSASALGVQSLGSKTAVTEKAGGAWLPLPDPRCSLQSRAKPCPEGRALPKGWHQLSWEKVAPGQTGKCGRNRAPCRTRGGSEPRPGSARPPASPRPARPPGGGGRGLGAGGRSAWPIPPGRRLGLTSLTSPCQSLSVRSPFMAFSRRGPASLTPPSSAAAAAAVAARAPRGPERARHLRATAPPPSEAARAVDSTSASAGGRGGGAEARCPATATAERPGSRAPGGPRPRPRETPDHRSPGGRWLGFPLQEVNPQIQPFPNHHHGSHH